MKKLLIGAMLLLASLAFAQTPRDIKVITWDDSTAYSQDFELSWTENPVGIMIPSATATASQTYTVQYYNPVDLTWYELETGGSAFTITVTSGRNTAIPFAPADLLSSTAKLRFRAGTVASPTTINSLVKLYVIYRPL